DPLSLQEVAQARDIRPRMVGSHNDSTGTLSGAGIRQPDDRDFSDSRMADEDVLDLFGRNVLAVANDDILGSPGDDEVVVIDPAGEITGVEITIGIESFGRVLGVQVTDKHLRSTGVDFTTDRTSAVEFDLGEPGTAVGVCGMV